ncbi:MAG TPA: DeoR/GlpR family DNA-binding transcription regulator [Puia sp.]|nr:DeoR/GlpR family DNA-binding transcription regulator [Puia sp.]
MNFQKRKRFILQMLERTGEADIKAVATALQVSEITARRDLNALAEDGLLLRTHGGALRIPDKPPSYPFADKAAVNVKAKEAIARRAATEIGDGDTLFLDCGSTVFHLCRFIKDRKVRIVTNSLPVVEALRDSAADVNIVGGELDRERQAVHGKMAEYHIRQYHVEKAFLGVDGISVNGLFAHSEKEAALTLAYAANSALNFLLCDGSKIGRESYLRFAGIDLIGTVVTDANAESCGFLTAAGITVMHAGS